MWLRLSRREPFDILPVPFERAVAETGIPYPNPRPCTDCTAVSVVWNEEARIGRLLPRLQAYFSRTVVCVQESTDESLRVAREMARGGDAVLEDEHRGFAEASAPVVAPAVRTEWVFVVAADEWPSDALLDSVQTLVRYAERHRYPGVWVPFRSTVEGFPFEEQSGHLRVLRRGVGWPPTPHSRPKPRRSLWWPHGHVDHDRSLDELVRDYLRYLDLGRGNRLLETHNRRMIGDACSLVASRRGWSYVTGHAWWPRAAEAASGTPPGAGPSPDAGTARAAPCR